MRGGIHSAENHLMKCIVHSKLGGTLLVLLGFACWLGASALIPRAVDWYFPATYSIAGLAFFIVGGFLPEHRDKRIILCRRAVLLLMAMFFWLAVSQIALTGTVKAMQDSVPWLREALICSSIAIAVGSYFMATYLIRGFRAPVEYSVEPIENSQAEQGVGDSQLKPVPHS